MKTVTMSGKELLQYYEKQLLPSLKERVELLGTSTKQIEVPAPAAQEKVDIKIDAAINVRKEELLIVAQIERKRRQKREHLPSEEDRRLLLATRMLIREIENVAQLLRQCRNIILTVNYVIDRNAGLSVPLPSTEDMNHMKDMSKRLTRGLQL